MHHAVHAATTYTHWLCALLAFSQTSITAILSTGVASFDMIFTDPCCVTELARTRALRATVIVVANSTASSSVSTFWRNSVATKPLDGIDPFVLGTRTLLLFLEFLNTHCGLIVEILELLLKAESIIVVRRMD